MLKFCTKVFKTSLFENPRQGVSDAQNLCFGAFSIKMTPPPPKLISASSMSQVKKKQEISHEFPQW